MLPVKEVENYQEKKKGWKLKMKKLIKNQIKCLKCGDIIVSKHRHDFVTCSCGNVSVDGGSDYCRVSFEEKDTWVDISVWEGDSLKSSYTTTMKEVDRDGETL